MIPQCLDGPCCPIVGTWQGTFFRSPLPAFARSSASQTGKFLWPLQDNIVFGQFIT